MKLCFGLGVLKVIGIMVWISLVIIIVETLQVAMYSLEVEQSHGQVKSMMRV